MFFEKRLGDLHFSTDKSLLQVNVIHDYLSRESYWSKNIPLRLVEQSINASFCFGVYKNKKQIAFARVITDFATFGYLADVFVTEEFRRQGISKQLMEFIMNCEALKDLRSFMLATLDAHGLYEKFGFKTLETPGRYMLVKFFEEYSHR